MTPLAQKIARELTLPVKDRTFVEHPRFSVIDKITKAHCFEITQVIDLADQIGDRLDDSRVEKGRMDVGECHSFLPADATWIEWGKRYRYGVLLFQAENFASGMVCQDTPDGFGAMWPMMLPFEGHEAWGQAIRLNDAPDGTQPDYRGLFFLLYGALALINTPRVIGRQQHMPHRGLERRLAKAMGIQGRFPLQAWTEIKLEVTPPKDMSDAGICEAHLTGQKALHFCRAHLRVRLGKVEVVRGHWRGDASLGIKRSRYVLTNRNAA